MVTHPVRRTVVSAVVTLALVAVFLLVPDGVRVYASNMLGELRAPGQPAFIAGHRGDRATAPENTLPALQAALDSNLEFVETDLQLTADGVAVLIHDDTVDRTTNGTGLVAEHTLADLRALDAGSWYGPEFAGVQVPLVTEFLDALVPTRKKALLEFKGHWTAEATRGVLDEIYARGVQDRVIVASFNLSTVANLGAMAPAIPRVIIKRDLPSDPVALVRYYDAIAILTTPASLEADPSVVDRMHAAGRGVMLYTLNSTQRWEDALATGVDGIVTDKPSKLDSWIAKTAPGT